MKIEKNIKDVEVGQFVSVYTNYDVVISGIVLGKGENICQDGHTEHYIRMRISKENCLEIYENEIEEVFMYKLDIGSFWHEFEEKHNMSCFDDEGNLKPAPTIINGLLVNGIWEKMTDDEKQELVENLHDQTEQMVDLINALSSCSKRNNELHSKVCQLIDERTEALQAVIDFEKKYDEIEKCMLEQYRPALKFLRGWLGFNELIKKI